MKDFERAFVRPCNENKKYLEEMMWREEMIRDYEDMLEEMLNVQELEASVLAAKQRAETGRRRGVTVLEVSFPFVDMFGEARRRLGLESQP